MTTATLAPKPVRKRRTRAKSVTTKPMKEQSKVTPIKDEIVPVVVTKQERLTKPNVDLIPLQSYVDDFNNRMKVHNYELQEAFADLHKAVTYLNEKVTPLLKR